MSHGAVPIVLGGGHETAYGHYLGYVPPMVPVGIINIDAHLDVRPWSNGQGHSGSPFRQALEHAARPLGNGHYVCLGAQAHAVSRTHAAYVLQHGGVIRWSDELCGRLAPIFCDEVAHLHEDGCRVYLSLDADALAVSAMPGVSPPTASAWTAPRCWMS